MQKKCTWPGITFVENRLTTPITDTIEEDSMAKKVGKLIREARTEAGLTQEQLARRVKGVSADDISLAERGEKDLTQAELKEIARATGVTQKSLIDAAKAEGGTSGRSGSSSAKGGKNGSSSAKNGKSGSSSGKISSSGKSGSAGKTSSGFKVSSDEKKMIRAYREADPKIQAAVKMILIGSAGSEGSADAAGDMLGTLLNGVKDLLGR